MDIELGAEMNPASFETVEGTSSGSSDIRTRTTASVELKNSTLVSEGASIQQ